LLYIYYFMIRRAIALPLIVLVCGYSFAACSRAANAPLYVPLHVEMRVEHLGFPAREPMVVELPSGTLFLTGYAGGVYTKNTGIGQTVPELWRSSDRGATWTAVNVGTVSDGARGNSDVDLAAGPHGALYFVALTYEPKIAEGTRVSVGVSENEGRTWRWATLSHERFDDRPWVAVTPDGAAHVVWSDEFGVYHSVSHDHGATWSTPDRISSKGGSSDLAAGPNGELAVRVIPLSAGGAKYAADADFVAVSTDGGATWHNHKVPGQRNWTPAEGTIPRWVEPVAWDSDGELWLLWTEASGVWLAGSSDQGASWKSLRLVKTSGDTLSYFPYLAAGRKGRLAATWFSGAGDELRWRACEIWPGRKGSHLRFALSAPLAIDSWGPSELPSSVPFVRSTAGEYLPVSFVKNGDVIVASPIQDPRANRYGFTFWRFKGWLRSH
jgi:hypothetical protein